MVASIPIAKKNTTFFQEEIQVFAHTIIYCVSKCFKMEEMQRGTSCVIIDLKKIFLKGSLGEPIKIFGGKLDKLINISYNGLMFISGMEESCLPKRKYWMRH